MKKSRCNSSTSCDRVNLATEAKYRTQRRLKTDIFMHFRVASIFKEHVWIAGYYLFNAISFPNKVSNCGDHFKNIISVNSLEIKCHLLQYWGLMTSSSIQKMPLKWCSLKHRTDLWSYPTLNAVQILQYSNKALNILQTLRCFSKLSDYSLPSQHYSLSWHLLIF